MATRLAKRVYNWENQWYHWNVQQFETIYGPRRWVHHALKAYDVPLVAVRARHGRESTFFRPHDWSVNIIKHHQNVAAALHEAAHAIYFYYYGQSEEHHNEKWLGIYVWLLIKADLWPKSAIIASLKAAKLPYSHMMTPDVLKRKKPAMDV